MLAEREIPSETVNDRLFSTPSWRRALTLVERHQLLSAQIRAGAHNNGAGDAVERRLERWRAQYPFSINQYFEYYLANRNLTEDEFVAALRATEQTLASSATPPPEWLQSIQQAYADPQSEPFPPPPGEEQIGFLNLIDPLLEQALFRLWQETQRLIETYPSVPFDVETIEDVLLMNLPDQILQRVGRTLVLELNVLRLQEQLDGETAADRFAHFVRKLREPEFVNGLFDEYPVLARQLAICIDQWLDVSMECLGRLCADWELLKATFSPGDDPGALIRFAGGAGDTHRRGRSVMIAEFESGLRFVYKPKSLAIDIHFQELLDWLNESGCEPPLRTFLTLDRVDYGWAEFVTRAECSNLEELHRFYRRQGIYLALLHVLASTDFHFENVIAAGEHPMLIDLETMLQPLFERYDERNADSLALKHMAESVLGIGLLPMRIWGGAESEGIDISGLGGAGGQLSPDRIPNLADQGTDAMHYIRERMEIEGDANRPMLDGVEANAIDYIEDIVAGFEAMYRLVMENRSQLLEPGGLIDRFADDSIRVLMRPTRTYAQLLYESFHPDMLRDALDRDQFLDRLWLVVPERNHMKEIISSEQEDLLHGDIPVFTSFPSSLILYDASDKPIHGVLTVRGTENVGSRIRALSDSDLARQLWYIRSSISTIAPDDAGPAQSAYLAQSPSTALSRTSRTSLLESARAAADYLCETAFEGQDDAAWVGLQAQDERHWAIATLGIDLYNGTPGIALFLAYAGALLEESRYTGLARKAYATILSQSELAADGWSSIGGYEGWGGILHLFTHLGALWSDTEILEHAERIANRIWGHSEQDTSFDVVRGSAGAIHALYGLHSVRPSENLIRIASTCGQRLLDGAQQPGHGTGWAPPRFGEQSLAGYAYGASGIAVALLRLHRITGEGAYADSAAGALEFERSVFDAGAANWPDLRTSQGYDRPPVQDGAHPVAWCSGAPGVGLARLQILDEIGVAAAGDEAAVAVATTLRQGFGRSHCLCHGDLGNLELLLQASMRPQWSGISDEVNRLAASIVDSIAAHGWQCGGPAGVIIPGLLLGVAGIGYQLLRLAEPDLVPSVLTMEPPRTAWRHTGLAAVIGQRSRRDGAAESVWPR